MPKRDKMTNPVIMMDIDGCLADFILGYTTLAKGMGYLSEAYGSNDPRYTSWSIPGLTGPQNDVLWEKIKSDITWWTQLKPLVDQKTFLDIEFLQNTRDVYFVTSRPGRDVKGQTEEWLELQGITNPTVCISSRKGDVALGLGATWMVDDKAGNAVYVAYHSPRTAVYLLDRAPNRFDATVLGSRVTRIESLKPFIEAVS